ncbi:MAG: FAD-dependent oxidoreductase, partial [Clostridiales bacterium]|nr:FAD-dependent oxidoreductase [Clostridiales bacterium]
KKSEDEIYAVKPYCTHLGCELSWNNLEKTWDCPCHGSRYDYEGNLLNEPSKKGLERIEIEE